MINHDREREREHDRDRDREHDHERDREHDRDRDRKRDRDRDVIVTDNLLKHLKVQGGRASISTTE